MFTVAQYIIKIIVSYSFKRIYISPDMSKEEAKAAYEQRVVLRNAS